MVRLDHVSFPYHGKLCSGSITCDGDVITEVQVQERDERADAIVIPGFIDTHTHGFRGHSSEDTDLAAYLDSYLDRGVTSVCPTVGPRPLREYGDLINRYRECGSPIFQGLHMEGPYLSPVRNGAISADSLYPVDLNELEVFLLGNAAGAAMMTIAPEVSNAPEAAALLDRYGVNVSFGHTDADYEETAACIQGNQAGITHMMEMVTTKFDNILSKYRTRR